MFLDIVGKENFFRICSRYLNEYKNKSVVVSDFIKTANETMNENYSNFFNTWLYKVGLPLLNVCENYSKDGKITGVKLTQESSTGSLYMFKLFIVYGKGRDKIEKKEILIKNKVTVVNCEFDWIIVNDSAESLCAVIYTNILISMLNDVRVMGILSDNDQLLVYLSPDAIKPKFVVDSGIKNVCNQFASALFEFRDSYLNPPVLCNNDTYSYIDDALDSEQYSCSIDADFKSSHCSIEWNYNGNNNDNDVDNEDVGDDHI